MAEALRIKTRAAKTYDYRSVDISEYAVGFTPDEEQYERDLARVLKRYGTKQEAQIVEYGDTVTLTCVSELPRYNKTGLPVIVGKGLFGKDIEDALVGMRNGETKTALVDEKPVEITVSRIVHTVLPELTDENVASFGMEGISTVRELRRSLIKKQVEGFVLEDENADMASAFIWQEVARNSVIERDPEEYAHILKKAERKIGDFAAEQTEGMDHDSLVNIFVSELDLAAIGADMMEKDGTCLTVEDYNSYIDKLCEAYPDRRREDIAADHTVLDYAIENFANYLAGAIDRYVADCFKELLTKGI
ncbi:MAG: hypothetical protein J5586_06950 [Clostridia bacterium]|nr:hypothetical protein [Clostridia bacterium]